MTLLEIKNLKKSFNKNTVLEDISLQVEKGEVLAIIGPSGSGKSTLLRCITKLETPDSGEINFDGTFGLVFQNFNLFPHHSVMKNITNAPIKVQKRNPEEVYKEAEALLEKMDLSDKKDAYPCELSGGQQQRVSIGRAMMNEPALMLADEPTGNLDSKASEEIISLLRLSNKKYNQTVIIITHDEKIALEADRIITIDDGRIIKDERNGK